MSIINLGAYKIIARQVTPGGSLWVARVYAERETVYSVETMLHQTEKSASEQQATDAARDWIDARAQVSAEIINEVGK